MRDTLESIAKQTCLNFTLYIGNDDSPYNLEKIINDFTKRIDIVYKRFDKNLGASDLVAHWNRCIDMVTTEEWLWLFSDDDIMDANCVELFYENQLHNSNATLFHFNVAIIDKLNQVTKYCKLFPDTLTSLVFFKERINYQIESFVVEYIFNKKKFYSLGRFYSFDLAWGADDCEWIKLGAESGIKTIKGALIRWRFSGENISSFNTDDNIVKRKINANIAYIKWAMLFFKSKGNRFTPSEELKIVFWILGNIKNHSLVGFLIKYKLIKHIASELNLNWKIQIVGYLKLFIRQIKYWLSVI